MNIDFKVSKDRSPITRVDGKVFWYKFDNLEKELLFVGNIRMVWRSIYPKSDVSHFSFILSKWEDIEIWDCYFCNENANTLEECQESDFEELSFYSIKTNDGYVCVDQAWSIHNIYSDSGGSWLLLKIIYT